MPVLENRAAQGDITAPGGARRLTGDQTAALRDSLSDKPAKNIILLIGDGMGDSEITAARNYAEGAGGFFKGIDALPLTGQYTHYALNKKTGKPDYVTDSAASATDVYKRQGNETATTTCLLNNPRTTLFRGHIYPA